MRYGATISAALHIGLLVLAVVGLPSLLNPDPPEPIVAIDVISEEDLAKLPSAKPPPAPAKPEPPKPAPAPVSKPAPPPPAPAPPPQEALNIPAPEPLPKPAPPPEPAPEPVAKPAPPPDPAPLPKEKPKPPPEPEPEPVQEVKKAPAAPPAPVPKRKPAPPPDEFQSLLKNLAREKEKQETVRKQEAPAEVAAKPAEPARRSPIDERRIAASLAQSIIRQVSPCWSIPAGAKDASNMSVAIRIRLNPDGALGAQPRIEDTARMGSDTSFRAVAESALRALRNPRCMPLKLPYDQYDFWKDITFVFDPREALGQ